MDSDGASPLVLIGYWAGPESPNWPEVFDFVDEDLDGQERHDIAGYLQNGTVVRSYMGASKCRICEAWNGSREFSDGLYVWPEGLAHYVSAHAVRLPQSFVDYVRGRLLTFDEVDYSDDWWKGGGQGQEPPRK